MAIVLAGCGQPVSTVEHEGASETADNNSQTPVNLPDAHALTGLSEVPELPDPQPIAGDFSQTLPATVTDTEGREVTVKDTSRILALDITGTLSRIVMSLGYGTNLVGRTVSSTESALADLPVVTQNGHQLNAEAILALDPSVVFTDGSVGPGEVLDQLSASGIPVVNVTSEHTIKATSTQITSVANALGAAEAGKALVAQTEADIKAAQKEIAQWLPETPLDAAFLYVRGNAGIFFILSTEDGATELLDGVGARDVAAAHNMTATTPASAEALLNLDPEVILVMRDGLKSTGGIDGLLARAGVAQTRAGQKQRVVSIPDGIALAFGPQTGAILRSVARALYGVGQ